jgi:hypothetical protein
MITRPKCPKLSERPFSDAGQSVRNVRESFRTRTFGRPSDTDTRRDLETTADPDYQFRARKKTGTHSVYTASRETFASPLPPSPFLGPDRDADRMAHRPTERDQLAREARRLAAQGLTARDVAAALRLSDAAVVALLEVDHARE